MSCKIKTTIIFGILICLATNINAADNTAPKVKIKAIKMDRVVQLLLKHGFPARSSSGITEVEPNGSQSFKVTTDSEIFYILSATHKAKKSFNSTCSMLLISEKLGVISTVDAVGPNEELRPWDCDSTSAISFSDRYTDGSMKMIALHFAYSATSGFTVPVVLKLNLNKPSLEIDETLTKKFDREEVETIAAARAVLNKR